MVVTINSIFSRFDAKECSCAFKFWRKMFSRQTKYITLVKTKEKKSSTTTNTIKETIKRRCLDIIQILTGVDGNIDYISSRGIKYCPT